MPRFFGRRLLPFVSSKGFRRSDRSLIPGLLAFATAGASVAWLSGSGNGDADKSLSLHLPLRELFLQPWQALKELPHSVLWDHFFNSVYFPPQLSMAGPVPSNISMKEISGGHDSRLPLTDSRDTSEYSNSGDKCSNGCLSRNSIAKAAAIVAPAVVNISLIHGFYGMSMRSIGSGTIIDSDGTILTCAHVVVDIQSRRAGSNAKVEVTLQDGRTFDGIVSHVDLHSDIAVVKIESKTPLPAAKLGSSAKLLPGEWVLALGCPHSLQNTITAGIVSCVDRKSSDLGISGMKREYLQTDCAINEGNSGGPLVNLDGEVVGVNLMKIQAADGVSFAVPMDTVSKIIEQFRKRGKVARPWIGLKMLDLNDMVIAQLKERDPSFPNVGKGILVPMVTPGSPAERAGFRPGDVVIELEGKPVDSVKEFIEIMGDEVGQQLKVLVKRANNKTVLLTVVPEEANQGM